ncbi:vacuolar import and degradation protein-domain-containing protein [Lentinula raphanica]|uniref:Vacuolar import and degradation protein-domain-containing protein n=1 Tax=Lentinula raphanica TaxID=153919 RepID=A0AA38PBR4_9AGAR|nr:vacuolar import and degradation protein-domain-containing protein [Lentinula raphanica]KAJ3839755.1 vacuolar import and degradation protein-domain-containing protein [Lentinula raphanica]KAJ3967009.1 vacuolar import and degradation protein-domain-containing protein [Lentinula raphanica]
MPEYTVIQEEGSTDSQKLCARCQCAVDATFVFLPAAESIVCAGCQSQFLTSARQQQQQQPQPVLPASISTSLFPSSSASPPHSPTTPIQSPTRTNSYDEADFGSPDIPPDSDSRFHCCIPLASASTYIKPTTHDINHSSPRPIVSYHSESSFITPSPLTDITRLRVRSQGNHCLYPGAVFKGTQRSGRSSYDVHVTIVDVDFASSFLCGYLRIRGLTEDWPELTTYFDAEIIGSRYGFLTQNWGATEQQDLVHWQRFPAFKHVRPDMKKPYLTISDRDRGAIFMRWKERFLIPDHRVQDISGASFAGFYYVCVDFNPSSSKSCEGMPMTPEHDESATMTPSHKHESPRRARRNSSTKRRCGRSPSAGPRQGAPVASMSGFYFHQNSEPYQQLSLSHVPERTTSSFEFR